MVMATKAPQQAAIYCRISKDTEGTGLGVTRQREDCEALAERLGWSVAEVVTDNDLSAYSSKKKRPGYERLIDGIEDGRFDGLLIWHPDRLHRQPRELESFIDVVERSGLRIATATAGDFDLSTPDGRLQARIVGAVARKESEDKSRRLRRKHQELAEAGLPSGGGNKGKSFGFLPRAAGEKSMTVDPVEAAEIRWAADGVLDGTLSLSMICRAWRSKGVWPRATPGSVSRVLSSARIAGMREHGGSFHPATWEAIIDLDELLRVRALLEGRKTGRRSARKHLLCSMLACGHCGSFLKSHPTSNNGKPVLRYACMGSDGCNRNGIHAGRAEEAIVGAVIERLHSLDFDAIAAEAAAGRIHAHDATTQMVEHQQRLDELAAMHALGELGKSEWLAAKKAVEARMESLRGVVDSVPQVVPSAETVEATWQDMSLDERRLVISSVVESITIRPTPRGTGTFDLSRIQIVWR